MQIFQTTSLIQCRKKIILGHLNINSLRNKFESIADVIQGTFDIFLLSETKIDESFPDKQFRLNNYRIFRKDRNRYGGGIIYVNENLPCKRLTTEIDNLTETIFLEVNVQSSSGYLWVVTNHQVKTKNFSSVIYLRL